MAKNSLSIDALCRQIAEDAAHGRFSPIYLLMGDEPYYPELVCREIQRHCIPEEDKDFNETVWYGSDVDADEVVSEARRYPMMAERRLVVVKEAQAMGNIDKLAAYCREPLDTTVLVLLLRRASLDKRKSLYKEIAGHGVIVDSPAIRDYAITDWIISYYASRKLSIDPKAAMLLGESAGTDLSTIAVETDKLVKNLPEGTARVGVEDIEKNVGVSRQFSIFELTRELSYHNSSKALAIAAHIGNSARFSMPMAVSALYTHFYRILKYAAAGAGRGSVPPDLKARALAGVNPYFHREYDTAVRNYPLPAAMAAVSLLCEYDWLGKGGGGQSADPGELMRELVAKLLALRG